MKKFLFQSIFIFGLFLFSQAEAKTLYVDPNGDDATSYATNGPSAPWATIGRAAWGSTSRSAPNTAQAAQAGDTVIITGGTYTTSEAVNSRWGIVYNPANSGTSASPITFSCVGACLLGAPNANAPVIGAEGRNYIKWYADVAQGHAWQINAYGLQSGNATATQVNTTPDTGPVVCQGATGCWIEGAVINGGAQVDYTDNWNGIRFENCTGCTIRNNTITSFHNQLNTSNGTCVTLYGSANAIVEYNDCSDVKAGVAFKDTGFSYLQSGIHVRYNRFNDAGGCFRFSVTAEDRNYIYQNLCLNSDFGLFVTGGGLSNDWIFNNTFVNMPNAGFYTPGAGSGGRFWNNILVNSPVMVYREGTVMPAETVIDLEHNDYFTYTNFYTGSDGNRTLASYKSTYPSQDQDVPASINQNPLFVNSSSSDFRLQLSSPARTIGVDIIDLNNNGSTTDIISAGAYITGSEIMGINSGGTPPPPPPLPPPPPATLVGDFNSDNIVNALDWSIMNQRWFTNDTLTDLSGDGFVNSLDWSILNANWFVTG